MLKFLQGAETHLTIVEEHDSPLREETRATFENISPPAGPSTRTSETVDTSKFAVINVQQ